MNWLRELRTMCRSLARDWGFFLTAVTILTLGLGLASYMFGALNAYVFRPLPFRDPERLVHVELAQPEAGRDSLEVSLHDYVDLAREQRSLQSLEAFYVGTVNLAGEGPPERVSGAFVTPGTLAALGVLPRSGRSFLPAESQPGGDGVAVIGHDLWRERYGGDPDLVGKTIRANSAERVVVGILPAGFRFPFDEAIWLPLSLDVAGTPREEAPTLEVFGRLRDGVTLGEARAELDGLVQRLAAERPDAAGTRGIVKPYALEYVPPEARSVLGAFFAAVLFVLVIACADVANLILARTMVRSRELSIRAALGAGRRRLALRQGAEALVIAGAAALLAFPLAVTAGKRTFALLRARDDVPAFWIDFQPDWRDFAFLAAAALGAALAASVVPALRTLRGDLTVPMRQGAAAVAGGRPGRPGRLMVGGQVALSAVLLIGAGLMTRSAWELARFDLGADVENVLTGRVGLFEEDYPTPADQLRFFETVRERLEALPGVTAAAVATSLPGTFVGGDLYRVEGAAEPPPGRLPGTAVAIVGDGYFSLFAIPVIAGRAFDTRDRADAPPVALVNRLFAEAAWVGESPLGKRLRLGTAEDAPWLTVTGVVPDVVQGEPDELTEPTVYLPLAQNPVRFASLAVKTGRDPAPLADDLRRAVAAIDADQPVYWVRTLEEWVRRGRFMSGFQATLFGVFALAGTTLAAGGIYAVLAYTVAQRRREIAVRRALGARAAALGRSVVRQLTTQTLVGLAVGVPAGIAFGRLLASELVEVSALDFPTLLAVPLLLLAVAAAASLLPVLRALRVDPMAVLRGE